MRTIGTRHVHPDFHTSGCIPNVGAEFNKEQFQNALKTGHVNSVTVFAKCLHGYCYFPTENGVVHPTLKKGFDLTGAMIDAAHEIGVAAPIYLTIGWSTVDSDMHPEWRRIDREGRNTASTGYYENGHGPEDPYPENCWVDMCFSGEYLERFYALENEVCERYDVDGFFIDITCQGGPCFCPNCIEGMKKAGFDPDSDSDAWAYYRKTRLEFMDRCTEILRKKHPDATLFFNSGGAEVYRPEYHAAETHFELEHLPSMWGGFNVLPGRACYFNRYGKELSYMTGKFHTTWGEVGGYKNPEALRYEMLSTAMYGPKCCVGDHLLPDGRLDEETYRIIGYAYEAVEACEPWLWPTHSTATLAVFTTGNGESDQGLYNMLLESHIDFNVLSPEDPLEGYKALILADCVELSDRSEENVREFIRNGGSVLFTGTSALKNGKFVIDAGAEYVGPGNYKQDYYCSTEKSLLPYGNAPVICYESAQRTKVTDGEVLADIREPWFDRTYGHFSDHLNTPFRDTVAEHPAAVRKGNVVYMAHPLCRLYCRYGNQLFREMLVRALLSVYTPVFHIDLPSAGRARLISQKEENNRYVFHAAYASPVRRGRVELIEDIVPLYDIKTEVSVSEKVKDVILQPQGEKIPFTQNDGVLKFSIPKIYSHQAVEIALS